jgi:phosphoribosylanthranilate isomerase
MANPLKIKVCGITSQSQSEQLLALGVDYIGMIHHSKSPRHIKAPSTLQNGVLVSVDQSLESILQLAEKFQTKVIQLHGSETPDYCNILKNKGFEIIKSFSINDDFNFEECYRYCDSTKHFLLDTKGKKRGGNGIKFNWNKLNEYQVNKPFFLSGGISPNDTDHINNLNHTQLIGIDINSQFEISPGVKDLHQISSFIKQLRQ